MLHQVRLALVYLSLILVKSLLLNIASMKMKALIILMTLVTLSSCNNADQRQYQGYVEGLNIYLAAPYSGTLTKAYVQRGQCVKKGELLFQLDANPQMLAIAEAKAALEQARHVYLDLKKPRRPPEIAAIEAQIGQATAQVNLADLRVKRNQILYNKHVLAKDSLDASVEHYNEVLDLKAQYEANLSLAKEGSRESQIKAQAAQIGLLKAKIERAKWDLMQKTFYAPSAGVIFDTYFRKGEFVGVQQPVAALLTPDNILIEFFVPADALADLQVGKKITFDCDGCGKTNPAVIQYISPEAEYVPPLVYSRENRDKLVFRVKAGIQDAARFKPGQPVVVTVSKNG